MHDFLPELAGLYLLLVYRLLGIDGVALSVFAALDGGLHELIVYLDRYVGAGNLAALHLGIDE